MAYRSTIRAEEKPPRSMFFIVNIIVNFVPLLVLWVFEPAGHKLIFFFYISFIHRDLPEAIEEQRCGDPALMAGI